METPLQVLIVEKSPSLAGLLVRHLEQANFSVAVVESLDAAMKALVERKPEVVLSSVSRTEGEHLARRLRKADRTVAIGLLYPPNRAVDAEPSSRMNGADLVLLGPVQEATLISSVRLLMRLSRQARELVERRAEPPPPLLPDQEAPPDLATLKRILVMEVKKCRRYKHPVSFLLAEIDARKSTARELARGERSRIIGSALLQFTQALRDIDLCVHARNERFIIFLPHTSHEGARVVAARLHERIRTMPGDQTVSIGVASYDGQGQASFGSLLKDASQALKRAQDSGGDRVELHEVKKPNRVFIA